MVPINHIFHRGHPKEPNNDRPVCIAYALSAKCSAWADQQWVQLNHIFHWGHPEEANMVSMQVWIDAKQESVYIFHNEVI